MSHVFVDHMFITETSHHPISRKELGQLCMYHLHVSPCPRCLMLIELRIETESSLVLREDCTPELSARYYSELWCGGEVAQTQSIQQTGFLGIRQGKKKCLCCWMKALSFPCCLISGVTHNRTHVEKPVALCVTPQGSGDNNNLFLYPPLLPTAHCHLMN